MAGITAGGTQDGVRTGSGTGTPREALVLGTTKLAPRGVETGVEIARGVVETTTLGDAMVAGKGALNVRKDRDMLLASCVNLCHFWHAK